MTKLYSNEIKQPKNASEGLQNFVQMIINSIEADEYKQALIQAVDLHQDIRAGFYNEVCSPDAEETVSTSDHLRALEKARNDGFNAGFEAGANALRAELKLLLCGSQT